MSFSKQQPKSASSAKKPNACPKLGDKRYVDMLKQNPPISNQSYAVMSFVLPTDVLKRKDVFFFKEFLKTWDINKSMEKFSDFMQFISHKYNINIDQLMNDYHEFIEEERANIIQYSSLKSDFDNFMDKNEDALVEKFNKENNFQTSVICVKNEGNYASIEEAKMRAKLMHDFDDVIDHHVCPVGVWVPLVEDRNVYLGKMNVDYLEEEMNELMTQKIRNHEKAKADFEARKQEAKVKAMEENRKRVDIHGGKVTQTLENGELVGVKDANTTEKDLKELGGIDANGKPINFNQLENLLFEGENIVTDKKTDHGQSRLLSGPFKLS
jgi:hypothetical protein